MAVAGRRRRFALPEVTPYMKTHETEGLNRPFAGLKNLLRQKSIGVPAAPPPPLPPPLSPVRTASDDEVFAEAMSGVVRMGLEKVDAEGPEPRTPPAEALLEETEVRHLRRLVDEGSGFLVCDTPEYMEGVGYRAPPGITERLHRGDFAVQAHMDLHGLTAEAAETVFDAFMKESIRTGKGAVLIIHGRGLSSPGDPVLKTKVSQWLGSGQWRKWVVAFTSARLCDGGAGATYVLLRRRPLTKRHRRRSRRPPPPAD
jgi:DNA-nicking Smr family endonuclease